MKSGRAGTKGMAEGRKRLRMMRGAVALLSVLAADCTTKDGILTSHQAGKGAIIVREKNNLAAKIFLDHQFTGKSTLDGSLDPGVVGKHVVHLVMEKYRPVPDSIEFELTAAGVEIAFELKPSPFGSIQVATQPGNAVVTLNGLNMGTTPGDPAQSLKLQGLPTGTYALSCSYGNYHITQSVEVGSGASIALSPKLSLLQFAFIEDFTNASCAGCPEVSELVETVIKARKGFRIANNETHAAFPSPSDPIYLGAKAAQDNLQSYYKPLFLPAVYCNGAQLNFGLNYAQVVPLLDSMLTRIFANPGTLNLVIQSDGEGGGNVLVEAAGSRIDGAFLRVELLQKELRFAVPPGTNNQTVFHNIIRGALNDAKGSKVVLAQGQSGSFAFRFDISSYAKGELFLVAYLQDDATKSVLQANVSPL